MVAVAPAAKHNTRAAVSVSCAARTRMCGTIQTASAMLTIDLLTAEGSTAPRKRQACCTQVNHWPDTPVCEGCCQHTVSCMACSGSYVVYGNPTVYRQCRVCCMMQQPYLWVMQGVVQGHVGTQGTLSFIIPQSQAPPVLENLHDTQTPSWAQHNSMLDAQCCAATASAPAWRADVHGQCCNPTWGAERLL